MRRTVLLFWCVAIAGFTSPAFAAISIVNAYTDAFIYDGANATDSSSSSTSGANLSVSSGAYSSTTNSLYSTTGDAGSFSALFTHSRGGDFSGQAYSQIELDFTMAVAGTYSAIGAYTNTAGYTHLSNSLYDSDTNTYLFSSSQDSTGTSAAFVVGGMDDNTFSGSLMGTLEAGHTYSWGAIAWTVAYPDADLGAQAGGGVSLAILPVPELSSVVVWSLLALIIGGACWWQRSRLVA